MTGDRVDTSNPLVRKLGSFIDLTPDDRAALDRLAADVGRGRAATDLIREGDRPENVFLLLEGWAYRYKVLSDGSRHIMAYLIPGDLCDAHVFILDRMDHSIGLLSDARFATIPKRAIAEITEGSPAIARALWWSTLVDEAMLRHWLVNIGRRDAYDRIAHLFCEMWARLNAVGLNEAGSFEMPVTQEQLGDTMGLTAVHVNRVLQRMRAEGLITFKGRKLAIHDMEEMRRIADFDPMCLHLTRRRA